MVSYFNIYQNCFLVSQQSYFNIYQNCFLVSGLYIVSFLLYCKDNTKTVYWIIKYELGPHQTVQRPGGGAVIFEMDTGVRPALRQAGAFGESTGSKNEGSLGESMIFGIRWEKNPKIWGLIGLKMRGHLVRARFFSFGEWNLAFGERKI